MLISRAFFGGGRRGGGWSLQYAVGWLTLTSLIVASIINIHEGDTKHSCSTLPTLRRAGSTWCERTAANADRLEQDVG